jgi:hypothetical protein
MIMQIKAGKVPMNMQSIWINYKVVWPMFEMPSRKPISADIALVKYKDLEKNHNLGINIL